MWFSRKRRDEVTRRLAFVYYILLVQKSTDMESVIECSNQLDKAVAAVYGSKVECDSKWHAAFDDFNRIHREYQVSGVSDFIEELGTERAKMVLRNRRKEAEKEKSSK